MDVIFIYRLKYRELAYDYVMENRKIFSLIFVIKKIKKLLSMSNINRTVLKIEGECHIQIVCFQIKDDYA